MVHFAFLVEITLLNKHLAVVTVEVGVGNFPLKSSKLPPTVSRVLCVSALCGLMLHTIFPYVTFFVSNGASILWVKKMLLVPTILLPIPCASLPNSLAKDVVHFCLSGPCIRWRYSCGFPVSGCTTEFASLAPIMVSANAYLLVIAVSFLLGLCLKL